MVFYLNHRFVCFSCYHPFISTVFTATGNVWLHFLADAFLSASNEIIITCIPMKKYFIFIFGECVSKNGENILYFGEGASIKWWMFQQTSIMLKLIDKVNRKSDIFAYRKCNSAANMHMRFVIKCFLVCCSSWFCLCKDFLKLFLRNGSYNKQIYASSKYWGIFCRKVSFFYFMLQ